MPRPGDKIHIPLPFDKAMSDLLKVKPTKDMPRPGAAKKKSVWNEVNAESGKPSKKRKARANQPK